MIQFLHSKEVPQPSQSSYFVTLWQCLIVVERIKLIIHTPLFLIGPLILSLNNICRTVTIINRTLYNSSSYELLNLKTRTAQAVQWLRLRTGRPRNRVSLRRRCKRFLSTPKASKPAVWSIFVLFRLIPGHFFLGMQRPGREDNHSPNLMSRFK
jgi:hypothetical protein